MTAVKGFYESSPSSVATGKYKTVQIDNSGRLLLADGYIPVAEDNVNGVLAVVSRPLAVSTYCPLIYTNFGAATKAVVKATPGNVFSFMAKNTNAAVRYFQLHNKATAPAGTDVPIISIPLPVSTGFVNIGEQILRNSGYNFSTGIGWAISTTESTFTDSATAADHSVHIFYV